MEVTQYQQAQPGVLLRILNMIDTIASRITGALALICFVALCGVVLLQVYGRLFMDSPPVWTEELSRYLFIYIVASASGLAYRNRELVAVDLFQSFVSGKVKLVFQLVIASTILAFCIQVLPSAVQFMMVGQWQTSPTLIIPMHYIYASVVLIVGNLALFVALDIAKTLIALFSSGDKSWK